MKSEAASGTTPGRARSTFIVVTAAASVFLYAFAYAYFKWVPRYDCVLLPPLIVGVFAATDRLSFSVRAAAISALGLCLLVAFLLHLWTLGYEGRNAVFGGMLPWSDSHGFYSDALRLAHGERFSPASSRRPLFAAGLSILLRMFDGNLRTALLVFAVVSALSMAMPALEVWRTHGWRSAAVVYLVLLFFERRFTGFVQSEHFGLPLGAAGFAALWRANALGASAFEAAAGTARTERARGFANPAWLALSGLFSITLGLLARAGPFFVVPALAVWIARAFPAGGRAPKSKMFLAALGSAGLAVAVNQIVFDNVGTGAVLSDYPAIAFGLIHGEDFTYLRIAHPELASLPPAQGALRAWHIVGREAWQHPLMVVGGLARSELELFISPFGIFSYVWTNPDDRIFEDAATMRRLVAEHGFFGPLSYWRETLGIFSIVNTVCMALLGLALVAGAGLSWFLLAKRRNDEKDSLLRCVSIGVLASAPFTPPWITSGVQIQTVTLAFVAAVPAVVLLGPKPHAAPVAGLVDVRRPSARWLAGLAPASIGAYLLALSLVRLYPSATPRCEQEPAARVRIFHASIVEVVSRRTFALRPKAAADLFASFVFLRKHFPDLVDSLEPFVREGVLFASAYDACRAKAQILVDPGGTIDGAGERWLDLPLSDLSAPDVRLVGEKAAR